MTYVNSSHLQSFPVESGVSLRYRIASFLKLWYRLKGFCHLTETQRDCTVGINSWHGDLENVGCAELLQRPRIKPLSSIPGTNTVLAQGDSRVPGISYLNNLTALTGSRLSLGRECETSKDAHMQRMMFP